jgi:periplasmic copper chaperone A
MRYALLLLSVLFTLPAHAAGFRVDEAWVRYLPGGVPAAGYFLLRNDADKAVELTGASSPAFGEVMLHQSVQSGGLARMRDVHAVSVPAGGAVNFTPGGYHLMLMAPSRKIVRGDKIPITLKFADGQAVTAQFEVRGADGR